MGPDRPRRRELETHRRRSPGGPASDRRPQPAGCHLQRKPADSSARSQPRRSRDCRLARPAPVTRTLSGTPLRRAGQAIGVLIVHRNRLAPFADDELVLLQSFADQAAIAIHNARLFNEVQARTADLQESLQQQTATADVLKVISRSAFDLEPALVAICETAARLCDADQAAI